MTAVTNESPRLQSGRLTTIQEYEPMSSEIVPFHFEGVEVRTVTIDAEPWWVLSDVARALGVNNASDLAARLDDDEKGVALIDTPGGTQSSRVINEAGLYSVILRSDKAEAKRFKRWLTHEVLPAIRKTGSYSTAPAPAELSRLQILELAMESEHRAIAEGARADQAEAQVAVLHNSKGLPVRNFVRKYFPDAKETDVFNMLYGKHLLICDPRGRWSDKQQKRIPGPTHMHPYVAGKRFFELAEELGSDNRMHLKTRVRRDAELALIGWLESQGFTSGVAHDSFAMAVNS